MADPKCANGEFAPEAVPLLCEGVDLMEQNISPEEGFLLSRLDGNSSVEVLCSSSGLGAQKTQSLLKSLIDKGVVILHGDQDKTESAEEEKPEDDQASTKEEETATEASDENAGESENTAREDGPSITVSIHELPELRKLLRRTLPKGEELVPLAESIFVNLESLSYYDLLGLARSADVKSVKKAYVIRSKSFHPDRFYRKGDREFRRKLQEIFKQLNKGYRALSDFETRAEYDSSLSLEEEEEFAEHEHVEESPPAARTRTVKGEASPWRHKRVITQKPIEEKVREKPKPKEEKKPSGPKLKLGLKGGKSSSAVVDQIKKKIQEKQEVSEGPAKQALKFYQGAMIERDRGNLQSARINLRLAMQYDPQRKLYKQAYEELDRDEEQIRAERSFRMGMDAMTEGNLQGASRHFKESLQLGYENPKLYGKLAEVVIELESNFERARSLCLKAIEMQEGVAEYHMTLARAYKGLGQKAAAIGQLEKVVKLEPKNKIAAKELKAMKRG